MTEDALLALKHEYATSKKAMEESHHVLWAAVLNEYGMNTFDDIVRFMDDHVVLTEDSLYATAGRVPSVHHILHKMRILVSIKNPDFVFSNENVWDEPIAAVLGHAFETLWKQIGAKKHSRMAVLTGLLFGTGVMKIGMNSRFVYNETSWSAPKPSKDNTSLGQDAEFPYGVNTEYGLFDVRDEWPNAQWVSPKDIFINPGARTEDEVCRIYHRYRRRLRDIKQDARYDARARSEVKGSTQYEGQELYLSEVLGQAYTDEVEYPEIVECFDLASRQFCVFNATASRPLIDWKGFGLPISNPFRFLRLLEHPESFWGIPYSLKVLPQGQAKNRLRALLIDKIGRDGKSINLYDPDSFQDENKMRQLQNARDGEWVPVEGLNGMQGSPVQNIAFGGANAEILRLINIFENDQDQMSGLTEASRNQSTSGGQTATEISVRSQQQGLTTEDFVDLNEEFLETIAADLAMIMLAKWPEEKLIKVTGPSEELFFWTPINRQRVMSNFTIKIVAGSTERVDKITMRRQFAELLPRIVQLSQFAQQDAQMQAQGMPPGPVNWTEMIRIALGHYDPTLASKILNQQSTSQLLMRLMMQHNIMPKYVSPELAQQVQTLVNKQMGGGMPQGAPMMGGGMPPQPGMGMPPSFEESNGIAAPANPGMGLNMPGNAMGRPMSEAMGVN